MQYRCIGRRSEYTGSHSSLSYSSSLCIDIRSTYSQFQGHRSSELLPHVGITTVQQVVRTQTVVTAEVAMGSQQASNKIVVDLTIIVILRGNVVTDSLRIRHIAENVHQHTVGVHVHDFNQRQLVALVLSQHLVICFDKLGCIAQIAQYSSIQNIKSVAVHVATIKVEVGLIRVCRLRPMLRP